MLEKNKLTFTTTSKKQNLKLLGLSLADLENSLTAASEGFLKNVFLVGVGYKFILEKDFLQVQIGRANTYDFKLPKNLKIDMIGPQTINC
jgi:ribosomal protein L6P/L9E